MKIFLFFDKINGKLKKIISFCMLNVIHFVVKCDFALKIS